MFGFKPTDAICDVYNDSFEYTANRANLMEWNLNRSDCEYNFVQSAN